MTWCKILEVANRSCWSGHLGSDHIRVNFVFRFGLVAILMNQVNIRSVPIGSGHFGQGQLFFLANKFMFVKNISLLFSGRFEFGSLFSRRFEFGSLRVGYIRVMLCRVFTFGWKTSLGSGQQVWVYFCRLHWRLIQEFEQKGMGAVMLRS